MRSGISRQMWDAIRKWEIVSPDDPAQGNGTELLNYCIVIAVLDKKESILLQNADNPSSRRAGSFYKRRPYSNPMPECASQQVCNAVFMRLKFVQPLCRCPNGMKNPCSTRMHPNDGHTVNLLADKEGQKTQTLIKVCEDVSTVKICQEPHDWMLLALQNVRTGKAHYLVVCKCPTHGIMEGPVLHTQPPYARIPGISVYGMLCVQGRKSRLHKESEYP
ncbi:uncharacterized protein TNCV_1020301 [Trichonephila clavipes]|nr:uncharacterized protein TNCV_1020301 [Trichonephila clavipes]